MKTLPPLERQFLPGPPKGLKKQYHRGLVSSREARQCLEAYNQWAEHWNVIEKAWQAYEIKYSPDGEAYNGYRMLDGCRPSRLYWNPRGHKFTMVARVRFKIDAFYPKPQIQITDLIWATWGYFGPNPLEGSYLGR